MSLADQQCLLQSVFMLSEIAAVELIADKLTLLIICALAGTKICPGKCIF